MPRTLGTEKRSGPRFMWQQGEQILFNSVYIFILCAATNSLDSDYLFFTHPAHVFPFSLPLRFLSTIYRGGSVDSLNICLERSNTQPNSKARLTLLNGRDADEKTPLVHAVENGRGAMASALLTAGAPPLFHELYNKEKGWNLLHLAASLPTETSSPELIQTLVGQAGYGMAVEDKTGDTCLHLAAEAGSERVCKALIELGLPVDTINSKDGRTAIHTAAAHGKTDLLRTMLNLGGASYVRSADAQGNTPLALAKYFGHQEVIDELSKW